MTEHSIASRRTPDDFASGTVCSDGGTDEVYFRYGASAETIGMPEKVFARVGDRYGLVDDIVLEWSIIADYEVEPGVVDLVAMPAAKMVDKKFEPVDIDALAAELADTVGIDTEQALALILFEGYELSNVEIADELDATEAHVEKLLRTVYDHYDEDRLVGDIVDAVSDVSEQQARIYVLGEGYGLDPAEIAAELGLSAETVRDELDAVGDHPELAAVLEDSVLAGE